MGFHHLVNTRYFSEAAIDFKKNGGRYTKAPRGSKDYYLYWGLQEERCQNGYKVGDLWIPGRYYHYLNFFPMLKVPNEVAYKAYHEAKDKNGFVTQRTADKIVDFPRFAEMQWEWFMFKHIAWNGGKFMGIESPGGQHVCCAKTRGAGFSYMEAQDACYNYQFYDGSKSYFFASMEEYLIKDGILNKAKDGLDWVNMHIPYWKRNRQKNNTLMHQRASYMDDEGMERGTMSEIMGVIVDNANKTRGKRGKKVTFEESGSFKNLSAALEISLGSLRDGSFYVGQASVFGTGGEEGPSIQGLEDIFSTPKAWDMLAFQNVWENSGSSSYCGYFVPCYRANWMFMDEEGNCDIQMALADDKIQRNKKKKSKDPKALDRRKAEYPRNPGELFQRLTSNGFSVHKIDRQIRRIQSSSFIQSLLRYGYLEESKEPDAIGGIKFVNLPKETAKPIEDYPHAPGANLTGCVTIVEKPYVDQGGKVPEGIYKIVFDPYYKEDAVDQTSLFAIYVIKLDNNIDPSFNRLPVAEFVGRRKKLADIHAILFMLCDYYNCTAQGEVSGGGQGVIDYAKQHKKLHRLSYENEIMQAKEIAGNQKNRTYLMNMNTDRKQLGISYMEDWHIEQRGMTDSKVPIRNIDKIFFIGLLREMKKYGTLNADRISAMICAMFELKSNIISHIKEARDEREDFYNRELFGPENAEDEDGWIGEETGSEYTTSY